MPVSAKFQADFTSFSAAAHAASVTLKDFEDDAKRVAKTLGKVTDGFTGVKLIQDATLMVEAVNRAGGAAKLTAAELQTVAAKAAEAAEKMRALGMAVPVEMQEFAEQLDKVEAGSTAATTSFGTFVRGLVTAEAIIGAAKMAVSLAADALKELYAVAMEGSQFADISVNFEHLTEQAGLLGSKLLGELRAGTQNTVTDFKLMQAVNTDLAADMHLTTEQFGIMARGAFALAQVTGGDVTTAFADMNEALLKGRVAGLAALAVKVDQEQAELRFADATKKSGQSLTDAANAMSDADKLQALRIGTLDAVADATARAATATVGLGDRVAQAQTFYANFRADLGKVIATSSVLEAAFVTMGQELMTALGGNREAVIKNIATAVNTAAIAIVEFASQSVDASRVFVTSFGVVTTIVGGVVTMMLGAAASAATLTVGVAALSAALPGATDEHRKLAAGAKETADKMWALVESVDKVTAAGAQTAIGNSATEKTLTSLSGMLARTRDAMIAARDANATTTPTLDRLALAHDGAGAAAGRHGDALKKLTAEEQKLAKDFALAVANVESAGSGYRTVIDTITGSVVEQMRTYTAFGATIQDLQVKYGLTEAQGRAFIAMLKAEAEELKRTEAANISAAKVGNDIMLAKIRDTGTTLDLRLAQIDLETNAAIAAMDKQSLAYTVDAEKRRVLGALLVAEAIKADNLLTQSDATKAQTIATAHQRTYDRVLANIGTFTAAEVEMYRKLAADSQEAADRIAGGFGSMFAGLADDAAMYGKKIAEGLYTVGATPAERAAAAAAKPAAGAYALSGYSLPKMSVGLAAGGPVTAGGSYLVGERGPELFSPAASGVITPNGMGGTTVVNTFHVNGTGADIARVVMAEITRSMKVGRKWPA